MGGAARLLVPGLKTPMQGIESQSTSLVGFNEMGFGRKILAPRNMLFGKRKDKEVGDEEPFIPGWPCSHSKLPLKVKIKAGEGQAQEAH